MFDSIVIGAGLSGAVVAERLATCKNHKVLVLEQRNHIAGNCYDFKNEHDIYLHHYGPHIFHTDQEKVWNYLTNFTEWYPYKHKVLAKIDGKQVPLPFNLNTIDQLFDKNYAIKVTNLLIENYGTNQNIPILKLRNSDNVELQELANFIYEKVFRGYSLKQWGVNPDQLDSAVTGRVPVRISRDNRYFQDKFQGIPVAGYSSMVERMLDHSHIELHINTEMNTRVKLDIDTKEVLLDGKKFTGNLVYTGMIDALFDFCFGHLPYRSLRFELENVHGPWQPVATVNYPNEHNFTRITEFGHFIGLQNGPDVIMREYPINYQHDQTNKMPYYPIFTDENKKLFGHYLKYSKQFENLILLGRLAEYKYYDMDDAIARSLQQSDLIN